MSIDYENSFLKTHGLLPEQAIAEADNLEALVKQIKEATEDRSEAYGTYAVGWNAALDHIRQIITDNK